MSDHLDQGDVAETVKVFFEKSTKLLPKEKSVLSLQEVDAYLEQMSKVTKEDDQESVLAAVAARLEPSHRQLASCFSFFTVTCQQQYGPSSCRNLI